MKPFKTIQNKFILTTIAGIFAALFATGQTTRDSEKIMQQIASLYNKEAYKDLYQMSAAGLRAKLPEEQLTSFYKSNIRLPYGKIVSWDTAGSKGSKIKYVIQFDQGLLDLFFSINDSGQLTAIQWLPHKNTANIKKRDVSNIKTNNPKQTKLELLADSLALDHLQNAANCGMSIGIITGGKTEMYYYGSTNKKTERLPDAKTMYEIGSISKTFTGILLARAIIDGKVKPGDDIRKYLPGQYPNLQYNGTPITLTNLANHTSRLPRLPADLDKQPHYDPNDPYKNYSREMMYSYLHEIKIDTLPGTVNEYSNFAVALLGVILENIYHRRLEDLVTTYITTPAKMNDTKFTLSVHEKEKMATGYNEDGNEVWGWDMRAFNACGGLKSDMADMMKYLAANMTKAAPDIKLSHEQTYKDAHIAIGRNWMLSPAKDGHTLIWHNGGTAGYRSFCGYIKDAGVGIVVLSNSGADVDNIALPLLREMENKKQ
jgi:CubicO group peptidase (beta-lactamase class C family)